MENNIFYHLYDKSLATTTQYARNMMSYDDVLNKYIKHTTLPSTYINVGWDKYIEHVDRTSAAKDMNNNGYIIMFSDCKV